LAQNGCWTPTFDTFPSPRTPPVHWVERLSGPVWTSTRSWPASE